MQRHSQSGRAGRLGRGGAGAAIRAVGRGGLQLPGCDQAAAGRNEAGERTFETDWTTVEAWEKLAEQCARFIHKGSRVRVVGSLQTQSWEDRLRITE